MIVLASFSVNAQVSDKQIEDVITYANDEYKDVLLYNMTFSKKEKEAFWPLLNEYLKKREPLVKEQLKMSVKDISELNDRQIKKMSLEVMEVTLNLENLKKDYLKKIMKELSAKNFMRFYQIDHFIEIARDYKLSSMMPLVRG